MQHFTRAAAVFATLAMASACAVGGPLGSPEPTGDEERDPGSRADLHSERSDAGSSQGTDADAGWAADTAARSDARVPSNDAGEASKPTGDARGDADASRVDTSPTPRKTVRRLRREVSLGLGESTSSAKTVTDVVVTGLHRQGKNQGFFVQDRTKPRERSGLWIYTRNRTNPKTLPKIERGTVLEITGVVTNYANGGSSTRGGLLEMEKISDVQVLRRGAPVPAAVSVRAGALGRGGSRAERYEGVLVEVRSVTVARAPGTYGDTELQSGLYIGPTLYDYTAASSPSAGDSYRSVVGPLNFSYDKYEIVPRQSADVRR